MIITYNAEYTSRLRAVFIGCGGHAIRSPYHWLLNDDFLVASS